LPANQQSTAGHLRAISSTVFTLCSAACLGWHGLQVVGDVLQRYGEPQAALDQRLTSIMFSSCVEDATSAVDDASGGLSCAGWELLSSGSGSGSDDEGQQLRAGASWEQALTPDELAAMEHGVFPSGLLLPSQLEQPRLHGASAQSQQRPVSPEGEESLPAEEKLALLKADFSGIAADEVSAALAACDGSLLAAADLLRAFAEEDSSAAAKNDSGLNGGAHTGARAAAAAATVPAAARAGVAPSRVTPPEPRTSNGSSDSNGSSIVPLHAQPKVQHLARRFPEVPTEALEVSCCCGQCCCWQCLLLAVLLSGSFGVRIGGCLGGCSGGCASVAPVLTRAPAPPACLPVCLQVALQSCNFELAAARRTLREAGYTEAEVEAPRAPPAAALPQPMALPLPAASAPAPSAPLPAASAGMSLSQATHLRNQTIFEVGGWPDARSGYALCCAAGGLCRTPAWMAGWLAASAQNLQPHLFLLPHAPAPARPPALPACLQQERAQAHRLQQCYRRCFELASAKHARGERASADELRMKVSGGWAGGRAGGEVVHWAAGTFLARLSRRSRRLRCLARCGLMLRLTSALLPTTWRSWEKYQRHV
jgi:hypothetical protein